MPQAITTAAEAERRRKIALALTGRPLSAEHRAKIAASHRGKPISAAQKAAISKAHRGKAVSAETRRKMSIANRGQKPTAACIAAIKAANTGRRLDATARLARSKVMPRGAAHHAWKGGITATNTRLRLSVEAKLWKDAVFLRDNHTCQQCRKRGGDLHAHHVMGFATHPDLRFVVSNGLTVCPPCHRALHGYKAVA